MIHWGQSLSALSGLLWLAHDCLPGPDGAGIAWRPCGPVQGTHGAPLCAWRPAVVFRRVFVESHRGNTAAVTGLVASEHLELAVDFITKGHMIDAAAIPAEADDRLLFRSCERGSPIVPT